MKTKEYIENATLVHGNLYDYSNLNFINSKNKVSIICKKHGEFKQDPYNHLYGAGCPNCAKEIKICKQKNFANTFAEKAQKVHNDNYDYSKVNYINSLSKVIIICKKHGEFEQTPSHHLQGQGCPLCRGSYSKNTEFIKKAIILHGDVYEYSKVNYINSLSNVIIICKKHGEFEQTPTSHLSGHSCQKCNISNVAHSNNKERFTGKAIKVHDNLYDYSKVNYINSKTNIIINCKKHDEFIQTPLHHLSGYGCPKCVNRHSTTREFIEKALHTYGDIYDYSKVNYINYQENVIIICKKHGEFEQGPSAHLQGKCCPVCMKEDKYNKNKDDLKNTFIEKAKTVHGDLYDYSKVEYVKSDLKLIIMCKKHGEFEQCPGGHLQGKGCCKCAYEKTSFRTKYDTYTFIEKAKKIYGETYTYTNSNYIDSFTDIIITCKEHGDFHKRPNNHISGLQGCPKCQTRKLHSRTSIIWLNFMIKYYNINIEHAENSKEYSIPTTRYRADGFCKETNTIYEFHGDLWHGNPKKYNPNNISFFGTTYGELYKRTIKRETTIKELGYNLVVMWEGDWNNINHSISILQRKFRK
jgi:hypothetical protein